MEVNRKNKLLIGLVTVALVLLGKLFYIQCINGSYKVNADNNSMVYDYIYPPRGIIYDRNGEILVGNQVCYDIMVTPREVKAFDTLALARALDVDFSICRADMADFRGHIMGSLVLNVRESDAERVLEYLRNTDGITEEVIENV